MSVTFYIKTTAFDDIGVGSPPTIDITLSDLNSFIIGPGELNGPAGLNRDSDLELYGFGALKWGEGVNQNQYRQLENFACPQKEDGDYWQPAGSPPVYDLNVHPIAPKDENDLGIGNGITTPLNGQSWYNTTDKTLYTFGSGSPATEWRSDMVATNTLNMVGYGIVNTLDPRDAATTLPSGSPTIVYPQDVITVGWADTRFVNVTGDTMTGILNMGGNRLENIADPDSDDDAINRSYADTRYVNVTGDTMTGILNMGGNRLENIGAADSGDDAVNRDTGDGRYVTQQLDSNVNLSGGTTLTIYNQTNVSGGNAFDGGLEVVQDTTGKDAFISFNENGSKFNFGRDGGTNDLFVGGGSFGATKHKVWHAGNDGAGSGLSADNLDGYSSSSFLKTTEGFKKSSIHSPVHILSRTFAPGRNVWDYNTLTYSANPGWGNYVLLRFVFTSGGVIIGNQYRSVALLNGFIVAGGGSATNANTYPDTVSEVWVPVWHRSLASNVHFTSVGPLHLTVYRIGWHQ